MEVMRHKTVVDSGFGRGRGGGGVGTKCENCMGRRL